METAYTKQQVEEIIYAYHKWLGEYQVATEDGNPQDLSLSNLNVYSPIDEDGEQVPFSDAINLFFTEHVEIDEKGHPVYTPFQEVLKDLINPL